MDNIQKAICAVLGVAGMIAMLMPSADPIGANAQPAAPLVSNAPSPQPQEAPPPPQPPEPMPMEVESFEIGEPAIDGNPLQPDFGMPYGASSQDNMSEQSPAEPAPDAVSYVPPAYAHIPGMPGHVAKTESDTNIRD
jgi:hypothetical protein